MRSICRVLVLEPAPLIRGLIGTIAEHAGYAVIPVGRHGDARTELARAAAAQPFSVVVIGVHRPQDDLAFTRAALAAGSAVIAVIDEPVHWQHFGDGRVARLAMPFHIPEFRDCLEEARISADLDCAPRRSGGRLTAP